MPFVSLDFWQDLVSLVYFSIAALIVVAVALGIRRSKPGNKWAWLWLPITVVAVLYLPVSAKVGKWLDDREFAAKSAAQIAHFEMRCKSAGEFIHEKVKGVEGIFIMKPRVTPTDRQYQSQFDLWDPYGTSSLEASYPDIYLKDEQFEGYRQQGIQITPSRGFRWIELPIVGSSPNRYRRLYIEEDSKGDRVREANGSFSLRSNEVESLKSQYGLTWEDISTEEDREKWIAGGRVRIIELATDRIIAERIGYLRDSGQGSIRNNRLAWSFANANACPPHVTEKDKDRPFLTRVFPR